MKKYKFCLLLTGTINPGNVPSLKRIDAKVRERDYIESLTKWINTGIPIVFVENSNFDSKALTRLLSDDPNIEYLKYTSQLSHLGKSSGEAEIIDYAVTNSVILNSSDNIIKVTGRYYISNIDEFLVSNKTKNTIWLKMNFEFADSRFFICSMIFLKKYLLKEFHIINEQKYIYFEHALARATHRSIADGYKWSLPHYAPNFQGYYGTDDSLIKNDLFRKVKRNLILKLTSFLINLMY